MSVQQIVTPLMFCAFSALMLLAGSTVMAGTIYRCDSNDGARRYTAKQIPGAKCIALSSYSPAQNPQRSTYSTEGSPKSNGVNLTIAYPSDWSHQSGERPHTLQIFRSPDKQASAQILIFDIGLPRETQFSDEEMATFFDSPDFVSEFMKGMPAETRLIATQKTKIEALPAKILEYKASSERVGVKSDMQFWTVAFIYRNSMVQLQFSVDGPEGTNTAALMQRYKPTFQLMANSVVLPDRWNEMATNKPKADPTNEPVADPSTPPSLATALTEKYGGNFGLTIFMYFVVTWTIGLALPVITRFLLMRRPVGKPAAIGLAILFFFCNLIIFISLGSQNKTHSALSLVAVASYFILRSGTNTSQKMPRPANEQR